jgi:hypothetical protein
MSCGNWNSINSFDYLVRIRKNQIKTSLCAGLVATINQITHILKIWKDWESNCHERGLEYRKRLTTPSWR